MQAHRSLVEARAAEDSADAEDLVRHFASEGSVPVLMEVLLFGPQTTQLWVRCQSGTDR